MTDLFKNAPQTGRIRKHWLCMRLFVDEKHFKNGTLRFPGPSSSKTQIQNAIGDCYILKFPGVVWTENICCGFIEKTPRSNSIPPPLPAGPVLYGRGRKLTTSKHFHRYLRNNLFLTPIIPNINFLVSLAIFTGHVSQDARDSICQTAYHDSLYCQVFI